MAKKFFIFRRSDPEGSAKRFSENGVDISILGIPADEIAFMTAGSGEINITFNDAGMYEENELFVGDSIEKTNITVACKKGEEMELIEKIMLFVSNPDGKTIMKFDAIEKKATFDNALPYSVSGINAKIKSQPTERVSQKISSGDAGTRFQNIIAGINFGSRDNKPFIDYNHQSMYPIDNTDIVAVSAAEWKNAGTGGAAHNITGGTGSVTTQTEATASAVGVGQICAQFAVNSFLDVPDVTIEDDYTMYLAIGDPGSGAGSFGSLFGDDAGETLGFSKDGRSSIFTMRHSGVTGLPAKSTTKENDWTVSFSYPDLQPTASDYNGCDVFIIRRDKDFNLFLHNRNGDIISFIPAKTRLNTPDSSNSTSGLTDGDLLLEQIGAVSQVPSSTAAIKIARFGVLDYDIGLNASTKLAKDLFNLYTL